MQLRLANTQHLIYYFQSDTVSFLTFADFDDQNADHYGLTGSATQVERIFPPEKVSGKQNIEGDTDTQSQALLDVLLDKKML